jgi:hypothetical protein
MLSTQVVAAKSTATTAQLEVAVALAFVCTLGTAYPELNLPVLSLDLTN